MRIILYATAAYEVGFESIITSSRDTDVLVLVIDFAAKLSRELWMRTEQQNSDASLLFMTYSYLKLSEGTSQHIMH